MYVCIKICRYTFTYIHTYTHTHTHTYIHTHIHTYIHTHTNTHRRPTASGAALPHRFKTASNTCIYIYMYIHTHTQTNTHTSQADSIGGSSPSQGQNSFKYQGIFDKDGKLALTCPITGSLMLRGKGTATPATTEEASSHVLSGGNRPSLPGDSSLGVYEKVCMYE